MVEPATLSSCVGFFMLLRKFEAPDQKKPIQRLYIYLYILKKKKKKEKKCVWMSTSVTGLNA